MPDHKNQHFVPRCYLRSFSTHGVGKTINLYNIGALRSIQDAPVKGQCARPYYYGTDLRIERALQQHERNYSDALRAITCTRRKLPTNTIPVLFDFMALQYCRTRAAALRSTTVAQGMLSALERDLSAQLPRVDTSEYAMMWLTLQTYPPLFRAISDLKAVIIENQTPIDFVTCDDPVVFSSRFHAERLQSDNFGVAAAGIFFMLPISPRLLLLCYDRHVYKLLGVRRSRGVLRDPQDVRSCNELQFLNASQNIYFADWGQKEEIESQFRSVAARREMPRTQFLTYAEYGTTRDGKLFRVVEDGRMPSSGGALIRAKSTHVFPTNWLSV